MVPNDDLLNSGPNIELVNTPTTVSNDGTTGQTHTRSTNVTLDGSVHLYLTNPTSQSGPYTIAADNRTQYRVYIADRLAKHNSERAMGPGEWLFSGDEAYVLPYTLKDKNDKLTLYIKRENTLNPIPFVVSYSNLVKGRSFNMTESKPDFQTHAWTNSMVRYLNHSLKSYHLNDSTLFSSTTTLTAPLLYRGRTWSEFTGYTGSIPSGSSSIPIYYSNPDASWESCMTVSGIKSKDFGLGEDATGRCLNPNSFLYANSTLVLDNNKTPDSFPMALGKSVAIVLNQSHAYYVNEDSGKVYTLSVVRTNGNNIPARGPLVLLVSAQGGGGSGAEGSASTNVLSGAGGGGAGSLACILTCPKEMDAMAYRIKLSSDTGAGGTGSKHSSTSSANGKDGCSLTLMEAIGSINADYLLEHPEEPWDNLAWNTFATIGGGKGAKVDSTSSATHTPGQGGTVQYHFGSAIGVSCVQTKNGSAGGYPGSTGGSVTASYALYNTDKEENQNINTKVYSSSATYKGGSAGESYGFSSTGGGGGGATAFSKGGDGGTSPSYNGNVGGKGAGGGGGSFIISGMNIDKAGNGANGGVPYLVLLGQPRVI